MLRINGEFWKRIGLLALLFSAVSSSAPPASAQDTSRVVLFGGSSVFTSYLPEETKHHVVLKRELAAAYPHQKIEVENWADNGQFIARYLLKGAYEKQRLQQKGIDVAIIRFGTNDQKRMEVPEYREHLLKFVDLLKSDFPGVAIIMETGIYLDYPRHYNRNRNQILNPYWEVSRKVAAQFGYPLVDYYAAAKAEAANGNWDIRVRKRGREFILDGRQDVGHENDPTWFTDIHPNPVGVQLAVREELRVLKQTFPARLPVGQVAKPRKSQNEADYSAYLNFPPERLEVAPQNNPDALQVATQN